MNTLSPSKVIEVIRLAQQTPDTIDSLGDSSDEVDAADAALEAKDMPLAQALYARALCETPHDLSAQVGLIAATPKLTAFDRTNLYRDIFNTYQDRVRVSMSEDHTPLSLGSSFERNLLFVVSSLASAIESVGQLEEGAKLREWAMRHDRRDGAGHRYPLAGYYLLVGNARRFDALIRSNTRGREDRRTAVDPFWLVADLVNALIKGEQRAEKLIAQVEPFKTALGALIHPQRPDVDLEAAYTMDEAEPRWAYVLWPAVHVHEQALSWLRQRFRIM